MINWVSTTISYWRICWKRKRNNSIMRLILGNSFKKQSSWQLTVIFQKRFIFTVFKCYVSYLLVQHFIRSVDILFLWSCLNEERIFAERRKNTFYLTFNCQKHDKIFLSKDTFFDVIETWIKHLNHHKNIFCNKSKLILN